MVTQGDIIRINLSPTIGHEQAGYRPVIVVNNSVHSSASNMTIVCPITNTNRNNPLHVELKGLQTKGFVMCDQIRAVDIRARNYKIVETVDEDTIWEICDIAKGSLDIVSSPSDETIGDEISVIDENEDE